MNSLKEAAYFELVVRRYLSQYNKPRPGQWQMFVCCPS